MSIVIDGKVYDETKFSIGLRNRIVARQEIEASKVRHNVELEKIEVLTELHVEVAREFGKRKVEDHFPFLLSNAQHSRAIRPKAYDIYHERKTSRQESSKKNFLHHRALISLSRI